MKHHELIRALVSEIRTLRRQLDSMAYDLEAAAESEARSREYSARKLSIAQERAYHAEQAAENERYNREQFAAAEAKAEKARAWGNDWEANHIMEQARRWYS